MKQRACTRLVVGLIAGLIGVAAGCAEKSDPKFAADTYDEYTEPVTNAVIGTPEGTTTISSSGEKVFIPAAAMAAAAGVGGQGGRTGTAGSSGLAGSRGTGGIVGADGGVATGGMTGFAGAIGTGGIVGVGGFPGTGGVVTGIGGRTGVGGIRGMGGVGGGGGGGGGFGFWHFDDCSADSHFLVDSSGFGANAQQAVDAACVPGISGLGVQIRSAKDIIQVPDEPQFTVTNRVAVAAWVNPNTVTGNQPLIIKRLNNQTSFSLGIHNGNIEMSVVLTTGKTFISSAPISPGVWTHVAGMYDGTFVFLFINGQQFGQVFAGGTLRNVFAPLRFGATTQAQFLDGILDDVFVSTQNISKEQLTALSCLGHPSSISVKPAASGPTPPNTSVPFDVLVTNNDVGACQQKQYNAFTNGVDQGITVNFGFPSFQFASPGQTVDFSVSVTGTEDADPGTHTVPISVFDFNSTSGGFEQLSAQFTLELQAPTGCFVSKRKELMITSTSVVDDPSRTFGDGAWSFGHLLRQLAPTADQAPAFALALFEHWLTDQKINGFIVSARPAMQQQILNAWPRTPTGDLDLDRAPFLLQAIVNRFDVRDPANGSAGQGRFVYAFTPPGLPFGQNFTVILEYNLPAATDQAVTDWANRWHALGSLPPEQYNAALEAITRSFTEKDATSTTKVNGSNLLQLRTNDQFLSNIGRWELREFQLSPSTGFFDEVTVKETPDLTFNNTPVFADFVNQKAADIKAVIPGAPSQTVPPLFAGQSFLAGSVFNDLIVWDGPGIVDPDARFHASLNTCNGCHGPETATSFLMVAPRGVGSESFLSPFLTGATVFDPVNGQPRVLNDLARRQTDLAGIVCAPPAPPAAPVVLN